MKIEYEGRKKCLTFTKKQSILLLFGLSAMFTLADDTIYCTG